MISQEAMDKYRAKYPKATLQDALAQFPEPKYQAKLVTYYFNVYGQANGKEQEHLQGEKGSLNKQVTQWLENNPESTTEELIAAFPGEKPNSLKQYRSGYMQVKKGRDGRGRKPKDPDQNREAVFRLLSVADQRWKFSEDVKLADLFPHFPQDAITRLEELQKEKAAPKNRDLKDFFPKLSTSALRTYRADWEEDKRVKALKEEETKIEAPKAVEAKAPASPDAVIAQKGVEEKKAESLATTEVTQPSFDVLAQILVKLLVQVGEVSGKIDLLLEQTKPAQPSADPNQLLQSLLGLLAKKEEPPKPKDPSSDLLDLLNQVLKRKP